MKWTDYTADWRDLEGHPSMDIPNGSPGWHARFGGCSFYLISLKIEMESNSNRIQLYREKFFWGMGQN